MPLTAKASNPNQTYSLIAFVLILLGLGGSYMWIIPGLKAARASFEQARSEEEGLRKDIDVLKSAKLSLNEAKTNLALDGIDLVKAQGVVPVYEDMPSIYIQMEDLMNRYRATLADLTYMVNTPVEDPAGGVKVPVTVSAKGTYPDLKRFIISLQTNIRPISLTTIALSPLTVSGSASDDSTKKGPKIENGYSFTSTGFIRAQKLSPAYVTNSATP